MNKCNKESALFRAKAAAKALGQKVALGSTIALASGAAFASGGGGIDTTEIMAAITDSQTKGIAIASAVTVMLFLFAGAKWLRRAK